MNFSLQVVYKPSEHALVASDKNNDRKFMFLSEETKPDYRPIDRRPDARPSPQIDHRPLGADSYNKPVFQFYISDYLLHYTNLAEKKMISKETKTHTDKMSLLEDGDVAQIRHYFCFGVFQLLSNLKFLQKLQNLKNPLK